MGNGTQRVVNLDLPYTLEWFFHPLLDVSYTLVLDYGDSLTRLRVHLGITVAHQLYYMEIITMNIEYLSRLQILMALRHFPISIADEDPVKLALQKSSWFSHHSWYSSLSSSIPWCLTHLPRSSISSFSGACSIYFTILFCSQSMHSSFTNCDTKAIRFNFI